MSRSSREDLTERERLAFKYLSEGKRRTDIAYILGVCPDTVRHIFSRAVERMGAETTEHALAMVLKAEIQPVKPPEGVD